MQSGYVKLWRKGIDSRVFKNDGLWKVWTWCLMKASYSERWVSMTTGRAKIEIKIFPGQFIYGRNSAAKELDMKPSTVRNRIEKLKNMQNVDIKQDNQFSIVSIINWESYQQAEIIKDSKEDKQRTGKGQAKDTNKKVKKVNKETHCRVVEYLNKKTSSSFKPETKATRQLISARLKEGFVDDDFKLVIDHQCKQWGKDPEMMDYLRPITLFSNKFESYLNAAKRGVNGVSVSGHETEEQIRERWGV